PIEAGSQRPQPDTGPGGPYRFGAPQTPVAPAPVTSTSSTTSTTPEPAAPPGSGLGTPPGATIPTTTTTAPVRQ
ncbi:MAG TPA: hypothetical protein VGH66_09825, partial [Acidimicrobiales bacterium]